MERAKPKVEAEGGLYERDFCLWVEEQVRLLRAGQLQRLDLARKRFQEPFPEQIPVTADAPFSRSGSPCHF